MKRLALLVLALVTLTACAAIPTNTQPKPIGSKDSKATNTVKAPEPRQNIDPITLVRDFIDVWFLSDAWGWDWHFPTFNVADSCITVGAVAWVLSGFLHGGEEARSEAAGTATS